MLFLPFRLSAARKTYLLLHKELCSSFVTINVITLSYRLFPRNIKCFFYQTFVFYENVQSIKIESRLKSDKIFINLLSYTNRINFPQITKAKHLNQDGWNRMRPIRSDLIVEKVTESRIKLTIEIN